MASKAFTFDPDFDYHPLFELCMADGTTEALDDPESFDEFIQTLKDGRYHPDTGIAPASDRSSAPLTGEELAAKLLELKKAGVTSNQDILKATGYWDGASETYSQANIDFFSAKAKIGKTQYLGVIPEPAQLLAMVEERHGINAAEEDDTLADILNELDLNLEPFVLAWSRAKYGEEREVDALVEELNTWFEEPGIYLHGQFREKLLDHIKGCCDVNNSWHEAHAIGSYSYTLLGGWIDPIREILVEFHDFILKEDVGATITQEQYLEVALTFCETYNPPEENKMKEYFSGAMYLLNQLSNFNFAGNALQFIKRNPQHREALFNSLYEEDTIIGTHGGEDGRWEQLLTEPYFSAFKDLIAPKCVEINAYWAQFEDAGVVDYSEFSEEVEALFTAAGINTSPEAQAEVEKQKKHREKMNEFARTAKEIGARQAAEAAEARKAEAERKAQRSDQEIWEEALAEFYIDKCLSECDRFRQFIEKDIAEIKDIHSDGNPAILINPPEWLVVLFKKNGVEFEA